MCAQEFDWIVFGIRFLRFAAGPELKKMSWTPIKFDECLDSLGGNGGERESNETDYND